MKPPLIKLFFLFLVISVVFSKVGANEETTHDQRETFLLIEDPGNHEDPETGLGAVQETFAMGKYEVTAKEYAVFLNSVAQKSDPYHLFDDRMEKDPAVACITKSLDSNGCFHYQAMAGREKFPITYVDLLCCLRFCNWLSHGGTRGLGGEEGSYITENGAYMIHHDSNTEWIEAILEAPFFLPTEDQWYKAAFYHHVTVKCITFDPQDPIPSIQETGDFLYWNYPTQTMSAPWNGLASISESANYFRPASWWCSQYTTGGEPYLTPVGTFKNSPGPYGTFDMGGNVSEWTYSLNTVEGKSEPSTCIVCGGSWASGEKDLHRTSYHALEITTRNNTTGFRVASKVILPRVSNKDDLTEDIIDAVTRSTNFGLNFTYQAGECSYSHVLGEVVEALAFQYLGIYFLIPYCLCMGCAIADQYYHNQYAAAEATALHALFDIACMLGLQYGMDIPEILAANLERCGFGCVVDFFNFLHNGLDDLLHAIGLPHSHGAPASGASYNALLDQARAMEVSDSKALPSIPRSKDTTQTEPAASASQQPGAGWGQHKHTNQCKH